MLDSIRRKTKGWVAYLIVGLISIPFALFGISEYFRGTSNVVVAIVNGDEILKEDFLLNFNTQKRRVQESLGDQYTPESDNLIKQSTIKNMVSQTLLSQFAQKLGYATTIGELQALIRANQNFQVDGQFSLEKYKQLLKLNGYNNATYEAAKSNELTQIQIKTNLLDSAFITPFSLAQIQALNNQQRDLSYISLNTDDYLNKITIDTKQIEDFYYQQQDSFFEPQKVKIDFVELSLEQIAKDIEVSDEELLSYYAQEEQRFAVEEERQAQHILLKSEQQANEIAGLLKEGGDFAKLAAEYSQDSGSKDQGGDLGFFSHGVMVPAFEAKVFNMQEGELSAPVKTDFGYHIIKLNKIKPATIKPFADVKSELLESYTQAEAQKSLYSLAEQLANLAYETDLEEVVNQMGLTLQSSEFFDTQDTILNKKIVTAAFSDAVLNKGENSPVLELSKDKFSVIRLKQKVPQRQKSFAEVKEQIKTYLMTLKAKEMIDGISQKILTALHTDEDKQVQTLLDKNQLTWEKVGWVGRKSKSAITEIVDKVFTMPKPKANDTTYSVQNISPNQTVIIQLSGVKIVADKSADKALEHLLLDFESEEIFGAILTTLYNNADLEVFARRL